MRPGGATNGIASETVDCAEGCSSLLVACAGSAALIPPMGVKAAVGGDGTLVHTLSAAASVGAVAAAPVGDEVFPATVRDEVFPDPVGDEAFEATADVAADVGELEAVTIAGPLFVGLFCSVPTPVPAPVTAVDDAPSVPVPTAAAAATKSADPLPSAAAADSAITAAAIALRVSGAPLFRCPRKLFAPAGGGPSATGVLEGVAAATTFGAARELAMVAVGVDGLALTAAGLLLDDDDGVEAPLLPFAPAEGGYTLGVDRGVFDRRELPTSPPVAAASPLLDLGVVVDVPRVGAEPAAPPELPAAEKLLRTAADAVFAALVTAGDAAAVVAAPAAESSFTSLLSCRGSINPLLLRRCPAMACEATGSDGLNVAPFKSSAALRSMRMRACSRRYSASEFNRTCTGVAASPDALHSQSERLGE